MLVGCRWVSVAPANVSGKDVDCRSRARPGHPAGARTIVGRSNLGASPEAIKAVPRLRGADGCFAPRWMVPKPAPASAGRMVVLPSKPRTYGAPLGVGWPFPGVTHTYGVLTPGYSHPTATRSSPPPRGAWAFRPFQPRRATRPALCGARERSPEACLGVDGLPHLSGPRTGVGEYSHRRVRTGVSPMQN